MQAHTPEPSDEEISTAHNLLVIDDEDDILKALRRQFRKHYTIYTADSAESGYRIMTEVPIHVIISDQRMPGMKGSEFFSKVRHEYPEAVRLLLTGYSDIQAVIDAINDGNVFRYITKPWDPVELDAIVRAAFERHDQIVANRKLLEKLIEQRAHILGMLAHDLHGALHRIRRSGEILRQDDIPPAERQTLLDVVHDTANALCHQVDDLLDSGAIADSGVQLDLQTVTLADFLDRVRAASHLIGDHRGVHLHIEQREVEQWRFDARRIAQALEALIASAATASEPNAAIALSVYAENGALIFDLTAPAASESIWGLDLAISARLAHLHGGAITTAAERGARLILRLPPPPG